MDAYRPRFDRHHRPPRKPRIADENIDRQIRVLHQAMAEKLLAQPALVEQVLAKLEERYRAGLIRHGAYMTWFSLLDNIDNREQFLAGLLDDGFYMRKLRRRTPFVGILTEEERQAALLADAVG
ncbi:hypothetical protein QCD60_24300 [Pokkaliibacter sp. MBI-7]|uniref:hypothetical protein n=1 Tax=Pokkaliibacter sp. MBI-7 TaxID=3040600 RepID=UPI00244BAD6E|nr:hypothetical protein [Pokkaliibacter sp. MBI-7]MDH2435651.1 hypothetical protein [Pokkaliibacter sp. MBI-7]